jgi:acyl dehydratase
MTTTGHEALPGWTLAEVDAEKMKVLALLLADPNPLHFDPDVAPRLGIAERPVNQGPSSMAMLANLVRSAFPRGRLTRLHVQLRGSVVAGEQVRAHGRIVAADTVPEGTRIRCEIALDAAGRSVMTGDAELVLPG